MLAFSLGCYDLIVLDYRVAPLNGLALIQKLRALARLAKVILAGAWATVRLAVNTYGP
jgi:DNA-binding NtrC family response regulator